MLKPIRSPVASLAFGLFLTGDTGWQIGIHPFLKTITLPYGYRRVAMYFF